MKCLVIIGSLKKSKFNLNMAITSNQTTGSHEIITWLMKCWVKIAY
jgi:hypothetical protein